MQISIWGKVLISILALGLILGSYFLTYQEAFKFCVETKIPMLQESWDGTENSGAWNFFVNAAVFSINNLGLAFGLVT